MQRGGDKLIVCTWVGTAHAKGLQITHLRILLKGLDQLMHFDLSSNV